MIRRAIELIVLAWVLKGTLHITPTARKQEESNKTSAIIPDYSVQSSLDICYRKPFGWQAQRKKHNNINKSLLSEVYLHFLK
jgi:hypothetical protein